jgi:hypothetical protein
MDFWRPKYLHHSRHYYHHRYLCGMARRGPAIAVDGSCLATKGRTNLPILLSRDRSMAVVVCMGRYDGMDASNIQLIQTPTREWTCMLAAAAMGSNVTADATASSNPGLPPWRGHCMDISRRLKQCTFPVANASGDSHVGSPERNHRRNLRAFLTTPATPAR